MAENGTVKLGDRARFQVNGFEGIVTGTSEYLQQCRQILITPEKLDNGKQLDGHWYDEPWVDVIKVGVHSPRAVVESKKGRTSGAPDRSHPASERR